MLIFGSTLLVVAAVVVIPPWRVVLGAKICTHTWQWIVGGDWPIGLSFRVELPDLVTSENFGSTGCPKVRANSNHPLNFGLGRHILKPFDMVNAHTGRFVLMNSNDFYLRRQLAGLYVLM